MSAKPRYLRIALLVAVLLGVSLGTSASILFLTSSPSAAPNFLGSTVTRDSITAEVVETAPPGLDDPNIPNTPDVWLGLVENAHQTIDMEIYTVAYDYLSGPIANLHNAIYSAAARGVKIRMLIDNVIYQGETDDIHTKLLMDEFDRDNNIEVRQLSWAMHSKVIIVDNEAAYVGSANESLNAMTSDREIGILVQSGVLVQELEKIFEAGWTENTDQPAPENELDQQWIYPVATPIYVPSWVPATEDVVVGFLNSATRTIHAPVYAFSGYSPLLHAVENAAGRGVKVQITVDSDYGPDPSSEASSVAFPFLTDLSKIPNVEIKTINLPDWSHSKVVIVDGEKAYVGSANWSTTSMINRREVGLAFEDATLASALETIFFKDWNSSYARWVTAPSPILSFITNTLIIFVLLLAAVAAVLHARRRKTKKVRRDWVAELWASSRQEV